MASATSQANVDSEYPENELRNTRFVAKMRTMGNRLPPRVWVKRPGGSYRHYVPEECEVIRKITNQKRLRKEDIIQTLPAKWHAMEPEQKKLYQQLSEKEKAAYKQQMHAIYPSANKGKGDPKREPGSYIFWAKHHVEMLRKKHPGIKLKKSYLKRTMPSKFKSLPERDKQVYTSMYVSARDARLLEKNNVILKKHTSAAEKHCNEEHVSFTEDTFNDSPDTEDLDVTPPVASPVATPPPVDVVAHKPDISSHDQRTREFKDVHKNLISVLTRMEMHSSVLDTVVIPPPLSGQYCDDNDTIFPVKKKETTTEDELDQHSAQQTVRKKERALTGSRFNQPGGALKHFGDSSIERGMQSKSHEHSVRVREVIRHMHEINDDYITVCKDKDRSLEVNVEQSEVCRPETLFIDPINYRFPKSGTENILGKGKQMVNNCNDNNVSDPLIKLVTKLQLRKSSEGGLEVHLNHDKLKDHIWDFVRQLPDSDPTSLVFYIGGEYAQKQDLLSLSGTNWLTGQVIALVSRVLDIKQQSVSHSRTGRDIYLTWTFPHVIYKFLNCEAAIANGPDEIAKKEADKAEALQKIIRHFKNYLPNRRVDKMMRKIYIPLNTDNKNGSHWFLCVIDLQKKVVQILDSMKPKQLRGDRRLTIVSQLMHVFGWCFWDMGATEFMDIENWEVKLMPNAVQQRNGYDCGVFVIEFMRKIMRDICLNNSNSAEIRTSLLIELLCYNEDETLTRNLETYLRSRLKNA